MFAIFLPDVWKEGTDVIIRFLKINAVRFIDMSGRAQQCTESGSSRITLWKFHVTVSIMLGI